MHQHVIAALDKDPGLGSWRIEALCIRHYHLRSSTREALNNSSMNYRRTKRNMFGFYFSHIINDLASLIMVVHPGAFN